MVNTKYYPGADEFNHVLENLPSIIVSPIGDRGVLIIGGWRSRCFTKADEKWIVGWSEKIQVILS